jgi:hypothetical protein
MFWRLRVAESCLGSKLCREASATMKKSEDRGLQFYVSHCNGL